MLNNVRDGHKCGLIQFEKRTHVTKDNAIVFLVGVISLVLLPYIHFGIVHMKFWTPDKPAIDTDTCINTCFDTVFRGSYEKPGHTKYKHIYFNCTRQTFSIWICTIVFILLAYESIKHLVPLLRQSLIRLSMLVLFLANVYPNYYSWWSYFSYYNEDFYKFFKHHVCFTVTEIITTYIVLTLCDIRNEILSWKVLSIVSISTIHIFVAGLDQFVADVIFGEGRTSQSARDIALMVPDCLHVIIPLWELYRLARRRTSTVNKICSIKEITACVVTILLGTYIGRIM